MADNPLVSIIIPTYNRPQRVKEAINSALEQTYPNIEVIVVDDNSDYDLEKIRVDDDRVQYLQNKTNRGAPYARNKGFKHSNGDYVNFLDDDDLLLPEKIDRQLHVFKETGEDVGVVMCHVRYERPEHDDIAKNKPRPDLHSELLKGYAVSSTGAHIIRRDVFESVGGFDESLVANQEYDLHIRLSKRTTYSGVDDVLTVNREAPNQISYDFSAKQEGLRQLWDKYETTYQNEGVYWYNYCRFTYLHAKYSVGRYFGRTIYTWLP